MIVGRKLFSVSFSVPGEHFDKLCSFSDAWGILNLNCCTMFSENHRDKKTIYRTNGFRKADIYIYICLS